MTAKRRLSSSRERISGSRCGAGASGIWNESPFKPSTVPYRKRKAQPYWLTLEREVAFAQQVQQVALHLFGRQGIGTAPIVPRQSRHGVDVGLLSAIRHAAQHQRVKHALPEQSHCRLLDRCRHMPASIKVRRSRQTDLASNCTTANAEGLPTFQ
jgi:hypothetical protein